MAAGDGLVWMPATCSSRQKQQAMQVRVRERAKRAKNIEGKAGAINELWNTWRPRRRRPSIYKHPKRIKSGA